MMRKLFTFAVVGLLLFVVSCSPGVVDDTTTDLQEVDSSESATDQEVDALGDDLQEVDELDDELMLSEDDLALLDDL